MILRATGRRALAALGVGAIALSTLLAAPSAAQEAPPFWADPGGGAWVAFTLDSYSPGPDSRTTYAPVNLVRHSSSGGAVEQSWFTNWEVVPNPPGADLVRWPLQFGGGGVVLERVDACDWTATSCRYRIIDPGSGPFWFFGGTPPTDPVSGLPNPDPAAYAEGPISLPPLPTIQFGTVNAIGTADPAGGPGTIRVEAPGTTDELGLDLTYSWVLRSASGTEYAGVGDSFEWTVDEDGAYCVQLTVTAADGHARASAACGAGTGDYIFSITGVAPVPGGGGGGGGGGAPPPGGGGPGGGGGGGIPGVGFSNPIRRAPSSITGGGGAAPTVVWLWRPEWYQSAPEPTRRPETAGQPVIKERRDIVVSGPAPRGSNAGPWLAGVGIFGVLGGSWLVSRRRRQRMLAEL